jgi:hypothetical protein
MKPDYKSISPLPWSVGDRTKIGGMGFEDSTRILDSARGHVADAENGYMADTSGNAAYIVHAANNYPRLVAAVKKASPS